MPPTQSSTSTVSYKVVLTSAFRRDYRRCAKRGLPIEEIDAAIMTLASGGLLPATMNDHPLKHNHAGERECHLRGDWLMIYRIDRDILTLSMLRTGTHRELGLGS